MKDIWYGDKRDLVKWGVLLHLAREVGAGRIIQAAYYRPTVWEPLEVDGREIPIPTAVIEHFRDIKTVARLVSRPRIEVIGDPFSVRPFYLRNIIRSVEACGTESCVLFLDPDTGLAPQNPGLEHVLDSEVHELWSHLRKGDVLVFYQHKTNRNGRPWIEPKRQQFARAISVAPETVRLARAPRIANDVVFFYCQKP